MHTCLGLVRTLPMCGDITITHYHFVTVPATPHCCLFWYRTRELFENLPGVIFHY
jgi:hypothetical protein